MTYCSTKTPPLFVYCNICAVMGHFINATLMTILLTIYGSVKFPLTRNYLEWNLIDNTTSCEIGSRKFNTEEAIFCISPIQKPLYCKNSECLGLDLGYLVISFHILSFMFQLMAGLTDCLPFKPFGYTYTENVRKGQNPLRFIEYSISASIMLICIALINGVSDINLIISIGTLTGICQILGLVVEYLKNPILKWFLHISAWIQFIAAYSIIFFAFFASANSNEETKPPDFVYVIVFLLFTLYGLFGLVQITELFCECNCCKQFDFKDRRKNKTLKYICPQLRKNSKCNPEYKELVYVILSLTAKSILGWMIFSNILLQ